MSGGTKGFTPGSKLRSYGWQDWERYGMMGTEPKRIVCKATTLATVLSLQHIELLLTVNKLVMPE